MARRSRFTPRSGGRKARQSLWIAPADQAFINVSAGASAIVGSFAPDDSNMMHPTVVRTRGEVTINPQTFGADLTLSGAFGVCIVSDEALAAGAASIPRPFDDAAWGGWYVWQSFAYRLEFNDATGLLLPAGVSYQVDSKAMRKVSANESVVLMCESQSGALQVAMHLRTLFLLS